MTGLEIENFYKADEKKYIVKENKAILDFLKEKHNEKIYLILSIEQMQKLINKIVSFFEFKYPDSFLNQMKLSITDEKQINNIKICRDISKALDIEQLKFRLYHNYFQFLECPYGYMVQIKKKNHKLWDLERQTVRLDENGYIEPYDLDGLKEYDFLKDIKGITRAPDLLGRFIESDIEVDYSELTNIVLTHKAHIQIRNMILNVIPLALIYSESTIPEWGYIRAQSFIRMFNKEYNLNINTDEIDNIMKRDYTKENNGKQKSLKPSNNS